MSLVNPFTFSSLLKTPKLHHMCTQYLKSKKWNYIITFNGFLRSTGTHITGTHNLFQLENPKQSPTEKKKKKSEGGKFRSFTVKDN